MTTLVRPEELIRAARSMLGAPWVHMGRSRSGMDCLGMIALSMRECGIDLFKLTDVPDRPYGRAADPRLITLIQERLTPAPQNTAGALAVFRFYGDRYPRHVGLIGEAGTVIHCNAKHSAVMEHGLRAHWAKWLHSVWLLPGVRYE